MSLNNTTERFNYIYGNTARKIEEVPYEYEYEGTSPENGNRFPSQRGKEDPGRSLRPMRLLTGGSQ